jgi:hypothetical protein
MTTRAGSKAMVTMRRSLLALGFMIASSVLSAEGCASENSIVGGECAVGYGECDGRCVHLTDDPQHCGTCETRCAPGVACGGGVCGGTLDGATDGAPNDGMATDGANDGSGDGASSDGASGDGASGDACPPPPYVTPAACGACGIVCVAPTSACLRDGTGAYTCQPPCVAPLVECGGTCIDVENDPLNCGACGKVCPSNLCASRVCLGATPGDVVVIGHDYTGALAGSSQAKVLTNAVLLPTSNPLRVLSYEKDAENAAVTRVKAIVANAAGTRTINYTVGQDPSVVEKTDLAATFDVVLIFDQASASPATLATVGAGWATYLGTFTKAGGVVVALDGAAGQGGMPGLVTNAGLLDVAGHASIAAGTQVKIVAPADAVGLLVISPYGTFDRSVTLQSNEPNGANVTWVARRLVSGAPADPVVIHKIVP